MRRVHLLGFVLFSSLLGCAEDKGLPVKPGDSDGKQGSTSNEPPKPEKDDPAAREIVTKALAAHTNGKPERLKSIAAQHLALGGLGMWIDGTNREVPGGRESWSVWPDRHSFRFHYRLPNSEQDFVVTGAVVPGDGFVRTALGEQMRTPPERVRATDWDMLSLDWYFTPKLLMHPQAIAHHPSRDENGGRPQNLIRFYIPGYPEWTLRFNADTHLLEKVEYLGYETGPMPKSISFSDHAEKHGLKVPGRTQIYNSNLRVFDLNTINAYEVFDSADKIDPKKFEMPK